MILGDNARREFAAVNTDLLKSAYSAGHVDSPRVTTVIVSSIDRSVKVLEDAEVVASGKTTIQDDGNALGEKVYTVTGSRDEDDSVQWPGGGYLSAANE